MHIIWAILGLFFIFFDIKKKNILILSLAISCLFSAIISYKTNNNHIQFFAFPFFLLLFNFLIRTIYSKEKNDLKKLSNVQNCIGKKALVKKDIGKTFSIDGIGFIEFNNELWEAKNIQDKEIKAGTLVEIVSQENLIMNVKVANNAKI